MNACLQRCGSMFTIFFGKTSVRNASDARELDLDRFAHFFRFLFERGVYIPPAQHEAWFVSAVHTKEHLERARGLVIEYLKC
jgi:glutamate-1-semialdehyde 2,1-aminomutase